MKIFVYGSLKRGFSKGELLKDCRKVGDCLTQDSFLLYPNFTYSFPYLFRENTELSGQQVLGELYEVDKKMLEKLDVYENTETGLFSREVIDVRLEDGMVCEAYVYIADKKILKYKEEVDITPASLSSWTLELQKNGERTKMYLQSLNAL
jgi:gamma-glutamylcyclotransferase (GGCT)/AIG2-like uncharacterized protein YtfP